MVLKSTLAALVLVPLSGAERLVASFTLRAANSSTGGLTKTATQTIPRTWQLKGISQNQRRGRVYCIRARARACV